MKKLLVFLLAAMLLLCLTACKGSDNKGEKKTNTTTQPVSDPSNTKVYYKTDAAGATITTVIVMPEEGSGETLPIKTIAPTEANTTTTTTPTFAAEEDNPFNDVELGWD